MPTNATFLVVTHPSQLQQQKLQRKVRSFTSRHNRRQKRVLDKAKDPSQILPSIVTIGKTPDDESHEDDPSQIDGKLPVVREYGPNERRKRTPLDMIQPKGQTQIELLKPYNALHGTGEHVSRLLDYYVRHYGPVYAWRPEMIGQRSVESFSRDFFQFTLSDTATLETMLSICQAQLELRAVPGSRPSKIARIHRSKALTALHKKIESSCMDDTVITPIIGSLTYDLTYGDWTSFEQNLKAVHNLINLRGGLETLVWRDWIRYVMSWAELRWATHLAMLSSDKSNPFRLIDIVYPSHPYNPDICLLISELPIGLQELIMAVPVSVPVMRLMQSVTQWSRRFTDAITNTAVSEISACSLEGIRLSALATKIVACAGLSPREYVACITLLAYVASFDGTQARHPGGLEEHMQSLPSLIASVQGSDRPILIWIALVLASAKDSIAGPLPNRWLIMDLLASKGRFPEWEEARDIARRFLWNRWLEERWESCWQTAGERRRERQEKEQKATELHGTSRVLEMR